ncbi:MAG: hypothetical protein O7A04_02120 [Acidobacteria bacterium]|nr:hypothetical protein [Acidobacteriota bacterium]
MIPSTGPMDSDPQRNLNRRALGSTVVEHARFPRRGVASEILWAVAIVALIAGISVWFWFG